MTETTTNAPEVATLPPVPAAEGLRHVARITRAEGLRPHDLRGGRVTSHTLNATFTAFGHLGLPIPAELAVSLDVFAGFYERAAALRAPAPFGLEDLLADDHAERFERWAAVSSAFTNGRDPLHTVRGQLDDAAAKMAHGFHDALFGTLDAFYLANVEAINHPRRPTDDGTLTVYDADFWAASDPFTTDDDGKVWDERRAMAAGVARAHDALLDWVGGIAVEHYATSWFMRWAWSQPAFNRLVDATGPALSLPKDTRDPFAFALGLGARPRLARSRVEALQAALTRLRGHKLAAESGVFAAGGPKLSTADEATMLSAFRSSKALAERDRDLLSESVIDTGASFELPTLAELGDVTPDGA